MRTRVALALGAAPRAVRGEALAGEAAEEIGVDDGQRLLHLTSAVTRSMSLVQLLAGWRSARQVSSGTGGAIG